MSVRNRTVGTVALLLAGVTTTASGQTTTNVVRGADGVTYQETRRVVERMMPTTEYQTRQEQIYQPRITNQVQSYQQNYVTPVTEYRWVSRQRGILNPFIQPYWTHSLEPVTRWENRPATVQVQVPTTEWVAETRTVSTPVTSYKPVKEEHVSRVAIAVEPTVSPTQPATAIASRVELSPIGGERMESDIPRTASRWTSSADATNRYR